MLDDLRIFTFALKSTEQKNAKNALEKAGYKSVSLRNNSHARLLPQFIFLLGWAL